MNLDELVSLLDLAVYLDRALFWLVHGPATTITVSRRLGYSGWQIERMLAGYGVTIGGRRFVPPDCLAFDVKARQATWARYLVGRLGSERPLPQPWERRR